MIFVLRIGRTDRMSADPKGKCLWAPDVKTIRRPCEPKQCLIQRGRPAYFAALKYG